MNESGLTFDRVACFSNLLSAVRKAALGKKHRPDVQVFLADLEPNILRLLDSLRAGTWHPGPYRVFTVLEPKVRTIAAVPFADRVIHHALLNILEPAFESASIAHSYACRPGKGSHLAAKRARLLACKHRFYLKGDVRRFFDSVDHEILRALLETIVSDPGILAVLDRILAHQPQGSITGKGIPIGNLTSQHFANFYLGVLDHAMMQAAGGDAYLRYMDDFLVFGDTKPALHFHKALASETLAKLKLELKVPASHVAPVTEGIPFLGLRVFPGTTRLQHAARSRFIRGWGERLEKLESNRDEDEFLASAASAAGHLLQADTLQFRKRFFESSDRGRFSRRRQPAV